MAVTDAKTETGYDSSSAEAAAPSGTGGVIVGISAYRSQAGDFTPNDAGADKYGAVLASDESGNQNGIRAYAVDDGGSVDATWDKAGTAEAGVLLARFPDADVASKVKAYSSYSASGTTHTLDDIPAADIETGDFWVFAGIVSNQADAPTHTSSKSAEPEYVEFFDADWGSAGWWVGVGAGYLWKVEGHDTATDYDPGTITLSGGSYSAGVVVMIPEAVAGTTPVEQSITLLYGVAAEVEQAATVEYAVAAEVEQSITIDHAVNAEVEQSITIDYAVAAEVEQSATVDYGVLAEVEQSITIDYAVAAEVEQSITILYDVDSALTPVEQSITIAYAVLAEVEQAATIEYAVNAELEQSITIDYGVDAEVEQATTVLFGVAAEIEQSITVDYGVDAEVEQSITVLFATLSDTVLGHSEIALYAIAGVELDLAARSGSAIASHGRPGSVTTISPAATP